MSHPPRSSRGHRDRNGDPRDHGENRRYRSEERRSPDERSTSQNYHRDMSTRSVRSRTVSRDEHHESKCSHICSRRGIVLICAVLTNALVLMCVAAAQVVMSGMTSMGGMGGFNINSDINLQGTELQQVRDLDMQYSQMRAPGCYGGIAFSLTFGVLSLLFVVSGNRPPHRLSPKLLIGALVFQGVGALVYVIAVGLYLHLIIMVNSTEVCQLRARLYARNGYTWMNCSVGGADVAVALFGIFTAILYAAGAALTFLTVRRVRRYLQEQQSHHMEREQSAPQSLKLGSTSGTHKSALVI